MEVLSVKDLSFKYPDSEKQVIENIGLTIGEGELVVLCGNTGSGKSTLLRLLKEELRPVGELRGDISYSNPESRIGFVMQNPHEQAVTDKVWHELAFGMENLGFSQEKMASRAAELSAYFGIEEWYDKSVNELSGGQLQLLNLASVMAMDPDILILDEPTAQLDPIAASQLISAIVKLHSDFALTVIIAEHRLEELLPVCDRMIVLEDARIKCNGRVKDVIGNILPGAGIYGALPAPYRLYGMLKNPGNEQKNINKVPDPDLCPLTVNDGRELLRQCLKTAGTSGIIQESNVTVDKPDDTGIKLLKRPAAIEMQHVYFRYGKENEDALSGLDLTVYTGEVFCLLGGNGSGKTTALGIAAGLLKPYSGSVKIFGKKIKEYKSESLYNRCLAMLPQDVRTLFMYNSVREELVSILGFDVFKDQIPHDPDLSSGLLKIISLIREKASKHPYDLSGGEQQLVGLAKVLAAKPKLLLLDEPSQGMDAGRKAGFADLIKELRDSGVTCLIVTHDVEFAAICADRCGMCFKGRIVSTGKPDTFFGNNRYYTTAACRMGRGILEGKATLEGLAQILTSDIKI